MAAQKKKAEEREIVYFCSVDDKKLSDKDKEELVEQGLAKWKSKSQKPE